jgi:hypothetical protein
MAEKTTITIQESTLDRFKQLKEQLEAQQNGSYHTADSFLHGLMDTWDSTDSTHTKDGGSIDAEDARVIAERVETHINPKFGDLKDQPVSLEASERRAIAEEVAGVLRE